MADNDKSTSTGCGTSFVGILQIAFIVLKLCRVIEWRWLWVLAPTWITAIAAIFLFVGIMLWRR